MTQSEVDVQAARNEDTLHKQFYGANSAMVFYKAVVKHLGPLIKNQTTYELLRDTHLSPKIVSMLKASSQAPGTYQLHHVHLKAVILYKYAEAYTKLSEDPLHYLHAVISESKLEPAETLRNFIGGTAGEIGISGRMNSGTIHV